MPGVATIPGAQLARLIGSSEAHAIFNVRTDEDRGADPRMIPASVRHPFERIADPAPRPARRPAATVFQSGGGAARRGIAAEVLEGGTIGWSGAGLPMIPAAALPASGRRATRHRPEIDRLARPLLIRSFVDPAAKFRLGAPDEAIAVAQGFAASPFEVEGVPISHCGERCSFDASLHDSGQHTEAFDRFALAVRAADTDGHDLRPQAAGLRAVSLGLSRQHRDDLAHLEAGMAVDDTFCRRACGGCDEGHVWPAGRRA